MMQAPTQPRPEKTAECGERPATERGQLSPGPGERQALRPEPPPGPRHPRPGLRLAPRPTRSPSPPARAPLGAGGGPRAAPSGAGGASQVRTPAFPLRPPLRSPEEPGPARWRWVRAEARGLRTGRWRTARQLRSVAETFQPRASWGTGAGGSPALSGTARSVPPSTPAASLRESTVSSDLWPASSPVSVGRFLWRDAGSLLILVRRPGEHRCRPQEVGREILRIFL